MGVVLLAVPENVNSLHPSIIQWSIVTRSIFITIFNSATKKKKNGETVDRCDIYESVCSLIDVLNDVLKFRQEYMCKDAPSVPPTHPALSSLEFGCSSPHFLVVNVANKLESTVCTFRIDHYL